MDEAKSLDATGSAQRSSSAQVALGLVLTAGAGLLISSFANLQRTNEGFNPDNLLTAYFETPDWRYKATRPQFYREYFDKLRAIPGVQSVGGVVILPMTNDGAMLTFEDPEHPAPPGSGQPPILLLSLLSTSATLQVPLLEGRDFTERDDASSPQVMIVNHAFAQKYFPGENVLGRSSSLVLAMESPKVHRGAKSSVW